MRKLFEIVQVAVAAGLLLWAVCMAVGMVTGGYDPFYAVCFGLMAVIGCWMLIASIKEMKGGAE